MTDIDKSKKQLIDDLADLRSQLDELKARRVRSDERIRQGALFAQFNPAPVLRFDKDGVIRNANLAASRILGEEARAGTKLESVLPATGDLDISECIDEGLYSTLECDVGQRHFQFVVLGLPEFGVGHLYGSDITERKHAEEELQRSEARYRTLVQATDDAIFAKDADGRYITVNTEHARRLSMKSEDVVGKTPLQVFPEDVGEKIRADDLQTMQSGKAVETENTVETPDGVRVFLVRKVPIKTDDGNITGLLGISRDITERKQAEEELARQARELTRSNRELENFAYVASHDLQEPLRMVSSYVQLLERRYKDKFDDAAGEFIGFAVDGATRMQTLINDLLAYSRVGTMGKAFEETDCNAVLVDVESNLETAISESDATIQYAGLPKVMADPVQLIQLFQNLVGNSIKYRGDSPPEVSLAAEQDGDGWLFSVRDNGVGFDPQYAKRIFGIFQRLHGRGEYPGTGIGLAICQKIVERHRGRIWAESKPDEGSTFFFTLPIIGHDGGDPT